MLIYSLIYIPFVLSAYFDFFDYSNRTKSRVLQFWIVIFTLFRGLRWKTGTDWDQFHYVFNNSSLSTIFDYSRGEGRVMESGYMFVNSIIHSLGGNYTIFLIVTNFFVCWCFADFAKRNTKYPIATFICLFVIIGLPFPVRQTIAFAIILWGIRFVFEKKLFKYIVICIVATLIHRSAIVALFIYFVPNLKIPKYIYPIIYVLSFFVALKFTSLIGGILPYVNIAGDSTSLYVSNYMNTETSTIGDYSVSLLNGVSSIVILLLAFYMVKFLKKGEYYIPEYYSEDDNDELSLEDGSYESFSENDNYISYSEYDNYEIFFNIYFIHEVIYNIFCLGQTTGLSEATNRIILYYSMLPIFIPLLFIELFPRYKKYMYFLFVLYMFYKFNLQIVESYYSDMFIPYKSIFDFNFLN